MTVTSVSDSRGWRLSLCIAGIMSSLWRQFISQPKYEIRTEKDVFIPVRDGVPLCVNIYRPDTDHESLLESLDTHKKPGESLDTHNS